MAQGIYIGASTTLGGVEAITSDELLQKYFTISGSGFTFTLSSKGSGWSSTNTAYNTTSTLTLTAKQDLSNVSFTIDITTTAGTASEKIILTQNNYMTIKTIQSNASTTSFTYSQAVSQGDSFTLTYEKKSYANTGYEKGWLYDFVVTTPEVNVKEVACPITDLAIGVEGVARRILYGYIGVEGVTRPCYTVKPATWAKYSCTSKESSIYVEDDEPSTVELERNVTNWTIPNYCTFSRESGYRLAGVQGNYGPGDGLTGSDLKDTWMNTGGGQIAYYIKSATVVDDGTTLSITITALLYRAEKITATTYTKGTTWYGTVISDTGGLPAEGTYVEGSIKDGYCVRKVNSTYYYYVLQ